jgi:hypothetical protein
MKSRGQALVGLRSKTSLGSDRASFTGTVDPYGGNACGRSAPRVNYLNPAAFTLAPVGGYGNVGKGSLRGPKLVTWDTGLFKEIPVASERVRFQFRAEFFNVLNHANFNNPFNSVVPAYTSGGFGTLTRSQS